MTPNNVTTDKIIILIKYVRNYLLQTYLIKNKVNFNMLQKSIYFFEVRGKGR